MRRSDCDCVGNGQLGDGWQLVTRLELAGADLLAEYYSRGFSLSDLTVA